MVVQKLRKTTIYEPELKKILRLKKRDRIIEVTAIKLSTGYVFKLVVESASPERVA